MKNAFLDFMEMIVINHAQLTAKTEPVTRAPAIVQSVSLVFTDWTVPRTVQSTAMTSVTDPLQNAKLVKLGITD